MGLLARNPQHDQREQGSGDVDDTPPEHATGVVHHEAHGDDGTVVCHSQRFERGELVEWTIDSTPAPWALVRSGDPLVRPGSGWAEPDTVASTSVRVGEDHFVLPPLDDLPHPGFDELEEIPDATARLRYEITGSPVGPILCDIRYESGRRPSGEVVTTWDDPVEGSPAAAAPEILVGVSFANYLRTRTGELTHLEAIADGGTVGDTRWTLLLLLHGIVQRQRYVDIYRSLPVIPPEIGWWGQAAPFVPLDGRPD